MATQPASISLTAVAKLSIDSPYYNATGDRSEWSAAQAVQHIDGSALTVSLLCDTVLHNWMHEHHSSRTPGDADSAQVATAPPPRMRVYGQWRTTGSTHSLFPPLPLAGNSGKALSDYIPRPSSSAGSSSLLAITVAVGFDANDPDLRPSPAFVSAKSANQPVIHCDRGHVAEYRTERPPTYDGGALCDRCCQSIAPAQGFYHCGDCMFDLCRSCSLSAN